MYIYLAHMIWGGLLMLVSQFLLMTCIGRSVELMSAAIGIYTYTYILIDRIFNNICMIKLICIYIYITIHRRSRFWYIY